MIKDLLKNKNAKEQAKIKGQEIAKVDFRGEYISQEYGIKIDIQSTKAIEGGVEVMARAWKGNKQLGFGSDGSVDIERFKIMNPSYQVPNGTTRIETDERGRETTVDNLKEDVAEATRKDIAHTAKLIGKEDTNIVKGKIGSTTSTFYPATGANDPVDGRVINHPSSSDWATVHDAASGTSVSTTGTVERGEVEMVGSNILITRGFMLFDTSSISTTNEISSATLSLDFSSADSSFANDGYDYVTITQSNPDSDDTLITADFNQAGSTEAIDEGDRKDITDISTGTYTDFPFNATGIGFIGTGAGGRTRLGQREGHDFSNNDPGLASGKYILARWKSADNGTAEPKLVIVHTSAENTHSIDLESGSSQYLSRADTAVLDITGDMTIEGWIKEESQPSSPNQMPLLSKRRYDTQNRSYGFGVRNNGGQMTLYIDISDDGSGKTLGEVNWSHSTGTWYHIAVVYDASEGSADFYVDGVPQGSTVTGLDTLIHSGTADLLIGASNSNSPSDFFDGKIDEVRMWDDIRTEAEIDDNKALQLVGDEANLVGYWQLNNGLGDTGGNALTLTNNNSAVFSTDIPFVGPSGPATLKTWNTIIKA